MRLVGRVEGDRGARAAQSVLFDRRRVEPPAAHRQAAQTLAQLVDGQAEVEQGAKQHVARSPLKQSKLPNAPRRWLKPICHGRRAAVWLGSAGLRLLSPRGACYAHRTSVHTLPVVRYRTIHSQGRGTVTVDPIAPSAPTTNAIARPKPDLDCQTRLPRCSRRRHHGRRQATSAIAEDAGAVAVMASNASRPTSAAMAVLRACPTRS